MTHWMYVDGVTVHFLFHALRGVPEPERRQLQVLLILE